MNLMILTGWFCRLILITYNDSEFCVQIDSDDSELDDSEDEGILNGSQTSLFHKIKDKHKLEIKRVIVFSFLLVLA